jgi:hypothetical protein
MGGNIVGISFVTLAGHRMEMLQATLDAVIAAENNVLNPILRALMVIFIGRQFLLTMAGHLTMQRFFDTVFRAGIIILLVTHNGQFNQWVRVPIYEKVPQALAAMVGGNYSSATANAPLAQQFDDLSKKGNEVSATIDQKSNSFWSMTDWSNRWSGRSANACFQIILGIIVAIWLLGQTMLAIVLAMFLPMLCFELFERTRGFVDQAIAKCVGFVAFGFATSFVLALQMRDLTTILDGVLGQPDPTIQSGMFFQVLEGGVLNLLTMAALPTVVGFGAGGVASLAAPAAFMAMRTLSLGAGAARATGRGGQAALTRMAGTGAAPNRIGRS